jgi:hypothetical protein
MPQYSNDGPTGAFGTFAHRNFADSGWFKLLANDSARIERSAAVKSRISCCAGTVPVGDWSSVDFESGVTAAHPAHEMAKAAKTSWRTAVTSSPPLPRIKCPINRCTSRDVAVEASHWLHEFPRVGHLLSIIYDHRVQDCIIGHGYFSEARRVLTDLHQLIVHGFPPSMRFGLRERMADEGTVFWEVKA